MIGASYGTVGDIEVMFTAIALIGLVVSVLNLREAWLDWRAISLADTLNGRLPIAQAGLRIELARVLIQLIFVVLGALAMTLAEQPDELDRPWNEVAIGIAFRWGLIVCALLIVFQSVENRRLRQYLRAHPPAAPRHEGGSP